MSLHLAPCPPFVRNVVVRDGVKNEFRSSNVTFQHQHAQHWTAVRRLPKAEDLMPRILRSHEKLAERHISNAEILALICLAWVHHRCGNTTTLRPDASRDPVAGGDLSHVT